MWITENGAAVDAYIAWLLATDKSEESAAKTGFFWLDIDMLALAAAVFARHADRLCCSIGDSRLHEIPENANESEGIAAAAKAYRLIHSEPMCLWPFDPPDPFVS
jgi:hypothetical protein